MISCIITSYNKKEFLSGCIDSVLANLETYKNGLEIIIIDDKSTDGSLDIAQKYVKKYPSIIRLIVNDVNQGAGISRGVGINNSKGDWISFIDADDFIDNDFFKSLEDLAIQYDADIIYGNYKSLCGDNFEQEFCSMLNHPNTLLEDMENAAMNMPEYQLQFLNVALTKRSLYSNGVEYCPSRFIEDTPTALCLLMNAKRVYVSDYCGYNYRQISDSLIHAASQSKHSLYLFYNMAWAIKYIATRNVELSNKLKDLFLKQIYSTCCLYRIDANDFIDISLEMWNEIKAYFSVNEDKMTERKEYAITHMSKIIKIK